MTPSRRYSGCFSNILRKNSFYFKSFVFWNSYLSIYFSLNWILYFIDLSLFSAYNFYFWSFSFFSWKVIFSLDIFFRSWIWNVRSSYKLSLDFFSIILLTSLSLMSRSFKNLRGELFCCLELSSTEELLFIILTLKFLFEYW